MTTQKQHNLRPIITGIIIGTTITAGAFARKISHTPDTQKPATYARFDEILSTLEIMYPNTGAIQTGKMMNHALKAYVDTLEDPYTTYLDTETNSGFQEELKGETDFEGIGAVIAKKEDYILIEEVIKESPAFRAGLHPMDKIFLIDTTSTKALSVNDAVKKIRGPKGTQVTLGILRGEEVKKISITRDKLTFPSVTSKLLSGNNNQTIGYLNIAMIGEETEHLLQKELTTLKSQDIQGIILDLRGNGGGYLPIAGEVASHFVPKDKLITSARYTTLGSEEIYSKGYNSLPNTPIVVLIDGLTASAGEIIALALQENIGSKLIGTQSFGKGSIQTIQEFDDGAALKYTVGKRYSPSGKNIDKTGITPDITLPFDATGYQTNHIDNQLQKAISLF